MANLQSIWEHTLRSESAEKISLGSQMSDLCLWKQNGTRNSIMGSKLSIADANQYILFFSKNCFRRKKIIKKIGCCVDFWIFVVIYMDELDQFKKNWLQDVQNQLRYYQNVKNWGIFSWVAFLFLKIWCLRPWKAYCSSNSIIARKHLIKVTYEKIAQFLTFW